MDTRTHFKRSIQLGKIKSIFNPADIGTKYLDRRTMDDIMHNAGHEIMGGRSSIAPDIQLMHQRIKNDEEQAHNADGIESDEDLDTGLQDRYKRGDHGTSMWYAYSIKNGTNIGTMKPDTMEWDATRQGAQAEDDEEFEELEFEEENGSSKSWVFNCKTWICSTLSP